MSTLKVDAIGKFDTTANAITFDSNNNASFTGSVNATNPMMNRNLIINGGMDIWQRGTTNATFTNGGYKTADRWKTNLSSLGTWTQTRSTDVPSAQGFSYSLKMDCTSADSSPSAGDYLQIDQRIEGQNLQHLLKGTSSAKTLTLSFWVKSNKTGTYNVQFQEDTNNRNVSQSYTISSSDTWEKKTMTFPADTTGTIDNDNTSGLNLIFWLGAGSSYTGSPLQDTWASSSGNFNDATGNVNLADSTSNEWYLTGVQLEVGSQATNFEFEPFERTLIKCHRYYRRWDRTGPPAEPYVQAVYLGIGQFYSDDDAIVQPNLTTTMRTAPDAAYSDATHFRIGDNGGGNNDTTAVTVHSDVAHTDDEIAGTPVFNWVSTSGTTGRLGRAFITDSTTGFIAMDAEL